MEETVTLDVGPPADNSDRSIVEVLAEAPGHLAFQEAEAVDAYVREERGVWDR